ncbi:MAG: hypothetical protein IJ025_03230 [Clostridia bacterium]|nr:hypothetical protein [Clostridia bacterium]
MIRIICPECKNAYLQNNEGNLVCPGCKAAFSESEENFLAGAQYYHEGDPAKASDCLMKYIVKNGAEPRAIFYKALCDACSIDEDTLSLRDLYVKLLEALAEMSDGDFVHYLALANDEAVKAEKALAKAHIELFADADAEKIKKEVSAIIKLQDEAKAFRNKLTEFAHAYNERALNKISVRFSNCFLVEPELASDIGNVKFNKIIDSINAHTVFTGILSNEIKNLEIYYRCIVMFFEKNRQKYEFLMASAEKFSQLAKLLEEGRYASIKGVPTICEKLKSAGYDFFQESLKDHDDEFEQQTETVVVTIAETVEVPVESVADNDNVESANEQSQEPETAETAETAEYEDVYSASEIEEAAETVEETEEAVVENSAEVEDDESDSVVSIEDITIAEETVAEESSEAVTEEAAETATEEIAEEASEETAEETVEIDKEETEDISQSTNEADTAAISEETQEAAVEEKTEEPVAENEQLNLLKTIAENGNLIENDETTDTVEAEVEVAPEATEPETPAKKHKMSVAPIIAIVAVIVAIIGIVAIKVVPAKINESNYNKAAALFAEKKYSESAEIYEKLGDYDDSEDKYLLARYSLACSLENEKKYDEAKQIFLSLGNYEDSAGKVSSCTYNAALMTLEQGKYDDAIIAFKTLDGYADSANMINECNYQKAISLISEKDYSKAIELLTALDGYSDSSNKLLEAKYGYVNTNLDAENETTLSYLKDLAQAKYKDSGDIRNKLLGTNTVLAEGVSTCINYSQTDTETNLEEVDNSKKFYYHVTVTNAELFTKKLTIDYTTSIGYHDTREVVLTEDDNTFALQYPSTSTSNYTVTFKLLSDDNTTLISQEVLIK